MTNILYNYILQAIFFTGFTCLGFYSLTKDNILFYLSAFFAFIGILGTTWGMG